MTIQIDEKKTWFDEHILYLRTVAEQVGGFAGALMFSEMVEEYLKLFPKSNFNEDFAEYLRSV